MCLTAWQDKVNSLRQDKLIISKSGMNFLIKLNLSTTLQFGKDNSVRQLENDDVLGPKDGFSAGL